MGKNQKLIVKETEITVFVQDATDFISLTDMTGNFKEGSALIGKWITNKNTLEYLGTWEKINNPNFNYPEFGVIEQNCHHPNEIFNQQQKHQEIKINISFLISGK